MAGGGLLPSRFFPRSGSRPRGFDDDAYRNIVSLRKSEDLFDDLTDGDVSMSGIAVEAEARVNFHIPLGLLERAYLQIPIRRVLCKRCGKGKREPLEFISDNPFCTKRFAYCVGRRSSTCGSSSGGPAPRVRRPSGSTKCRSARAIPTGSP